MFRGPGGSLILYLTGIHFKEADPHSLMYTLQGATGLRVKPRLGEKTNSPNVNKKGTCQRLSTSEGGAKT